MTVHAAPTIRRRRVDESLVDALTALLLARDEDAVVEAALDRAQALFAPVTAELHLDPADGGASGPPWRAEPGNAIGIDVRDHTHDGSRSLVVPVRGRDGTHGVLVLHRPPGTPVFALRSRAAFLGHHIGLNLERVRGSDPRRTVRPE